MIAVVAGSAGALLGPLVERCRELGPTELWAPLAAPGWLAHVPGLAPFARRRPAGDHRGALPLLLADGALRLWARDHADRRYLVSFALRAAIDAWTARELRRRPASIVIASSLAARRTFATARTLGVTTVLILDVPLLRALHRDLDRAAAIWPARAFLRRFRAPSWAIARQEAERALADVVLVRGAYARALCIADGIPAARIGLLPAPPPRAIAAPSAPTGRLLLAGLAAARHGIDTALAAARLLGKTLVVRIGEGTEPAGLAGLAGVTTEDGPVDAIFCPAICETYAPELHTQGVPIIASPMASADGCGPDPFEVRAFADAIATPSPAGAPPPMPSLAALLGSAGPRSDHR